MEVQPKIQEDAFLVEDHEMIAETTPTLNLHHASAPGITSFDTQLKLCKESHIDLDEDPDATILRRLSKFFEYSNKIEPGSEYFSNKKQADKDSEIIENEIIVFGCDFKKLKLVKKEFLTTSSVIINPSNFKLIYTDAGSAWKAIEANARDPKALANKRQSEEDPLPRCWMQMKPYTFHNRLVQVFVRFATEQERNIEPMKEEWISMYDKCKTIYNSQEEERKEKLMVDQLIRKERLQTIQQRNSKKLYDIFAQENQKVWKKGNNANPGANKDDNLRKNSRSRSRSIGKHKDRNQMVNEVRSQSNYSIHMGSHMPQAGNPLNDRRQDVSLSAEIRPVEGGAEYQWNGRQNLSTKYNWSYSEYMKRIEEDEERSRVQRAGKVQIITIDD